MKRYFNLQCFAEGDGGTGGNGGNGGQQNAGNGANAGGYSFEQAEEIATARAERATKSALKSYFTQQGMTQEEAEAAISDYKTRQEAGRPDVDKLRDDLAAANKKIADQANTGYLTGKNVKSEDLDYVMFKVSAMVDDKTDFKKAADTFIRQNPRYTTAGSYRVSTGTQTGGNTGTQTANEQINAMIRGHIKR